MEAGSTRYRTPGSTCSGSTWITARLASSNPRSTASSTAPLDLLPRLLLGTLDRNDAVDVNDRPCLIKNGVGLR